MAPSVKKALKAFIQSIPDDKLTGFSKQGGTIFSDSDFRLDMQGWTGTHYNLQIQANSQSGNTSVRRVAPATVAGPVLVSGDSTETAADIRKAFVDKILV